MLSSKEDGDSEQSENKNNGTGEVAPPPVSGVNNGTQPPPAIGWMGGIFQTIWLMIWQNLLARFMATTPSAGGTDNSSITAPAPASIADVEHGTSDEVVSASQSSVASGIATFERAEMVELKRKLAESEAREKALLAKLAAAEKEAEEAGDFADDTLAEYEKFKKRYQQALAEKEAKGADFNIESGGADLEEFRRRKEEELLKLQSARGIFEMEIDRLREAGASAEKIAALEAKKAKADKAVDEAVVALSPANSPVRLAASKSTKSMSSGLVSDSPASRSLLTQFNQTSTEVDTDSEQQKVLPKSKSTPQ